MSAELIAGEVTVPAAAQSLQVLLGSRVATRQTVSALTVRAGTGNTGVVYFGKSDVTLVANRAGYLLAGEEAQIMVRAGVLTLDKIHVIGNGTDVLHVSGVGQ